MNRIQFRLPITATLPFLIAAGMAVACFFILDALRYTTCSPWELLPVSPRPASHLSAAMSRTLFVSAPAGELYCNAHGTWARCALPTFNTLSADVPAWIKTLFHSAPIQNPVVELRRDDNLLFLDYYALTRGGAVWMCSTNFRAELARIFRWPTALLLLVPAALSLLSLAIFVRIGVQSARPSYRDFDGNVYYY